jgi:pyruvate dehydrogenase E1 component alpha subunit
VPLRRREDYVFSTHRGHGHAIAKGADLKAIMAELMGATRDSRAAQLDIAGRARAFGMPGATVDGNDVLAVRDATAEAVERMRRGEGPHLTECRTYRMEPHCGIITDERQPGEKEKWRAKDPIDHLCAALEEEADFPPSELAQLERAVMAQIDEAVRFGRESP